MIRPSNPTLWKLKRWLSWWSWADDAYQRDRRRAFTALTGLHATYAYGRRVSEAEVIAIQARKIRGLEMQLTQQSRGMQRKVARLQRQLTAQSSEEHPLIPSEASTAALATDESILPDHVRGEDHV